MKRIIYCLIAILMCIFGFSACDDNNGTESSSQQQATSIEFVKNEIVLQVGEQVQAEVVTSESNVFIFWSISDKSLATISDDGVITALAEGQTMCYANFDGATAMCLVKILPKTAQPMLSISVPYAENKVVLYAGDSLDLMVGVKLGNEVCNDAQLSFVPAKAQIASVENGVLTAGAVGNTTVQIKAVYGDKTATLIITVEVVQKA